eukprot:COSAG06_NODE_2187_length_7387_cov_8.558452_3_plen_39_part_00
MGDGSKLELPIYLPGLRYVQFSFFARIMLLVTRLRELR